MNASAILPFVLVAVVLALLIAVTVWLKRAGPARGVTFLSHLVCEKCGSQFDYAWIPFVSLTAVRLLDSRYFACPVCGEWSVFKIWDTRVDPASHRCNIQIGPL